MQRLCPILERPTDAQATGFSRGDWRIVRCQETGFVYLADPPEYSELTEELAWEKTSVEEKQRRAQEEPVATQISTMIKQVRYKVNPRRNKVFDLLSEHTRSLAQEQFVVLDVGCGCGGLMLEICERYRNRKERIVPLGIEISAELSSRAAEKFAGLGGRALSANAIDGASQFEPSSVDVVIMSSFLEHEARPLTLLRQLRTALKPSGVMILKVPNFSCWNRFVRGRRWCGFRYPDHVNYFTPRTLTLLAHEASLTVARQTLSDRFPLNDNMYAVLRRAA